MDDFFLIFMIVFVVLGCFACGLIGYHFGTLDGKLQAVDELKDKLIKKYNLNINGENKNA